MDIIVQIGLFGLTMIGSAAISYGAIRADLARAIAMAETASETATRAHDRIDIILERRPT